MRTVKQIKEMLAKGGATHFWGTKREVKELPKIITDNEVVTYATSGYYESHTWLIVSTSKRIILNKQMNSICFSLFGLKQIEIPLNKINSIVYKKGFFLGEIEIWDGATMMKVTKILNKTLVPFVNAVNKAKEKFERAQQTSVADELIKFKGLLDQGVITRKEFERKKRELLDEDQ